MHVPEDSDGLVRAVVRLVKAHARLQRNRHLLRRDGVGAADEVVAELVAVYRVCADVLLCLKINMVARDGGERCAVIDLRPAGVDVLHALHQPRQERHRLPLVDAPRQSLAALGRDERLAAPAAPRPVSIGRCLLHLGFGAHTTIVAVLCTNGTGGCTFFPYGTGYRNIFIVIPQKTANLHLARAPLYLTRIIDVFDVYPIRFSLDNSYNAADFIPPVHMPGVVGMGYLGIIGFYRWVIGVFDVTDNAAYMYIFHRESVVCPSGRDAPHIGGARND